MKLWKTPLSRAVLLTLLGVYLLFRSFQHYRNPSPRELWSFPYSLLLTAGLALYSAFETYRNRKACDETQVPSTSPERLTRSESLVFRAMGLFVIAVGLAILGISCWLAWRKWDLLGPPIAIGVLLTVGGVVVFRWSLPQRAAKPSRD